MLKIVTLQAEYFMDGPGKWIGLAVLLAIVGGVIWWKRAKARKIAKKIEDRLRDNDK